MHTFLILYSCYSYSKFEVLIVLILSNMHNVVDSAIPLHLQKHKISMISVRTLQYSVEGRVFALFTIFVCFFLLLFNAAFESFISIFQNFWNQNE